MSKIGEVVLFTALTDILGDVSAMCAKHDDLYPVDRKVRQALIEYADAGPVRHPTRWNAPSDTGGPIWARDCKDHPLVRGTDYSEVFKLIGTSGCSRSPEMWQWTVLGVLETPKGNLLVYPGDWIVEVVKGYFIIMPDADYRAQYLGA